jgi:hypothetical protein
MNPWIPVIIGVVCHAFIAGLVYGKLSQQVRSIAEDVNAIKSEKFGERIVRLETRLNGKAVEHHAR